MDIELPVLRAQEREEEDRVPILVDAAGRERVTVYGNAPA